MRVREWSKCTRVRAWISICVHTYRTRAGVRVRASTYARELEGCIEVEVRVFLCVHIGTSARVCLQLKRCINMRVCV